MVNPNSSFSRSRKLVSTLVFSACISLSFGYSAYSQSEESAAADTSAEQDHAGMELYETHCASCHGTDGAGGAAPPVVDNAIVAINTAFIAQILQPSGFMPSFARTLSDEEVAEIINYVRATWYSDLESVTAEDVTQLRF